MDGPLQQHSSLHGVIYPAGGSLAGFKRIFHSSGPGPGSMHVLRGGRSSPALLKLHVHHAPAEI